MFFPTYKITNKYIAGLSVKMMIKLSKLSPWNQPKVWMFLFFLPPMAEWFPDGQILEIVAWTLLLKNIANDAHIKAVMKNKSLGCTYIFAVSFVLPLSCSSLNKEKTIDTNVKNHLLNVMSMSRQMSCQRKLKKESSKE